MAIDAWFSDLVKYVPNEELWFRVISLHA